MPRGAAYAHQQRSIIIHGVPGSGKTTVLRSLVAAYQNHRREWSYRSTCAAVPGKQESTVLLGRYSDVSNVQETKTTMGGRIDGCDRIHPAQTGDAARLVREAETPLIIADGAVPMQFEQVALALAGRKELCLWRLDIGSEKAKKGDAREGTWAYMPRRTSRRRNRPRGTRGGTTSSWG